MSWNVTVSPVLTRNAPSIESMREIVAQSVVGSDDGAAVGVVVGTGVGSDEGTLVGADDGTDVGAPVGALVGT